MVQASEKLKEVDRLRALAKTQQSPPRGQVIHTVRCHFSGIRSYLDQPWVVETGNRLHVRGGQSINNFELFLERNKEIAFIVYRQYDCCTRSVTPHRREQGGIGVEIDPSALLQREHIHILADELKTVLEAIFVTALQDVPCPDLDHVPNRVQADTGEEISHPYLWYYHGRTEIGQMIDGLPAATRRYAVPFRDYVQGRMSEDWTAVDALLREGMVTAAYIDYLFVSVPECLSITQISSPC